MADVSGELTKPRAWLMYQGWRGVWAVSRPQLLRTQSQHHRTQTTHAQAGRAAAETKTTTACLHEGGQAVGDAALHALAGGGQHLQQGAHDGADLQQRVWQAGLDSGTMPCTPAGGGQHLQQGPDNGADLRARIRDRHMHCFARRAAGGRWPGKQCSHLPTACPLFSRVCRHFWLWAFGTQHGFQHGQ